MEITSDFSGEQALILKFEFEAMGDPKREGKWFNTNVQITKPSDKNLKLQAKFY